jgi:hypothetical protein
MSFTPFRTRLVFIHLAISLLLLLLAGLCFYRLIAFPPDVLGAAAVVGLVVALSALPAFLYRLVVLLQARYEITQAGALRIAFGARREILPIDGIEEIRTGTGIPASLRAIAPGWRKTWQGRTKMEGEQPVDWFATDHGNCLLLIVAGTRLLAISPANPFLFAKTVTDLSTLGSLEKIQPVSTSPSPRVGDILADRTSIALLSGGLLSLTGLGAFLIGLQSSLPGNQFFKFDPSGAPASEGDPARLLLLPLVGGFFWLINAGFGWMAWRKNDRSAAYIFWIVSLLISIGLWFATGLLLLAR